MDLYKYLCFILLTTVCYIDAVYVLTVEEYTWTEATKVCTLATPSFDFHKDGITPDLANLPSVDAWLGYTEKMTPFEYFGCAKKSDLGLTAANFKTEGDPGKCWSACKTAKAVAVKNNECYCLHDDVNVDSKLLNDKCDIGCPSQGDIVCGGKDQRKNYVSLYKTTYTGLNTTSIAKGIICLWYDKSTNAFLWTNCTTQYQMICYKGNVIWVYNGSHVYGDWKTMTTRCFNDGGIPSNYNNTYDWNATVTANLWTGIIRNDVIYRVTDPTNVNVGKYGYVDIRNRQLLFTNDDTMRKRALCVEGTVTTDTTTRTVETTISSGKTTTSSVETTIRTGKTTTSSVETTITSKRPSFNSSDISNIQTVPPVHETDGQSAGSSDVGAIVGATLAIIIVIIVIVVLVVLWKRGVKLPIKQARKLEKGKTQTTNMTYSFARPDNTIQGKDESSFTNYVEVDISKLSPGGGVTQNDDTNRTSCSSDEPHTYFVLEKVDQGPYDTTKTTPQIHDQHTLNPNNKVSLEESSNYDHIGAHDNNSKTLGLDNPYNTTTLASSNKYNGFKNNAFNRNDVSDDTYNHINGQSRQTKRNQWDNPYNTTALGHPKSDHGVTNIAFNCNDEYDDTYNHIGDQSGQNDQTITDNPYNTTTLGNAQTYGVNNSAFNNYDDTYNHINGQVSITRPTFTDNDYATLK